MGTLILVDDQGGSQGSRVIKRTLVEPLVAAGIPAVLSRLESADLAFVSKDGLDIGIELKRLDGGSTDLLQSLRSGRLSGHQIPKMLGAQGAYDYGWLIIEGTWRSDETGRVSVYQGPKRGWGPARGNMAASELDKRLLTLEIKYDRLYIKNLHSRADTVRFISNLYRWWSDKSLSKHASHLAVHDTPTIQPVSDYRAFYMRIPGVGYSVSLAVENHFKGGPRQAVCASVAEWADIACLSDEGKSRKIGNSVASKIVGFLKGGF